MALLAEKGVFTVSLKVKDVMALTGAAQGVVNGWILKGWLKATKEQSTGRGGFAYSIEERDLMAFMATEHYAGHPEDILYARMFNRIPLMEDCYPLNLIADVLQIKLDPEFDEQAEGLDIWDINVREFKNVIIQNLTEREQKVISLRFQMGLTFDECAKVLMVTRERVRQIQLKAERKIRYRVLRLNTCYSVPKREYDILMAKCCQLEKTNQELQAQLDKILETENDAKKPALIDFHTVDIAQLDLSVRSYNCLHRAGIQTLGDILCFDQHQGKNSPYVPRTWQQIRNLGIKSLMEIARKTFEYCGYRIRQFNEESELYEGTIPILAGEKFVVGGVSYPYQMEETNNE